MQNELIIGVAVASITALGATAAAAVQGFMRIKELRLRLEQAKQEMRFQRDAMDITAFIGDWDGFMAELKALMNETGIDRFLILRAWNGHLEPRWTSAIFQLHKDDGHVTSYVHVELDRDYVDRLRMITTGGPVLFNVDDVENGALIRGIYETEGIKEALWAHIETLSVKNSETRAVTYCSFGSRELNSFDTKAVTRASLVVGRLKGIASQFTSQEANK